MNKSELGRVIWNRFNPLSLNRIEILRGPASSVYGAYAIGGVVSMITKSNDTTKASGDLLMQLLDTAFKHLHFS